MLSDSFEKLHLTVTGRKSGDTFAEGADVNDALETLLKHFGIRDRKIPASLKGFEEKLDYLLTASDIMFRKVTLEPGWSRDAMGVMVTSLKDSGAVITVVRNGAGVYVYKDPKTGKNVTVHKAEEQKIGNEAYCFYRPLPLRSLTLKDLIRYMTDSVDTWDIASFIIASLMVTLVGMILPKLNHILMGEVVTYGSMQLLGAVMSFMLFAMISSFMLSIIKQFVQSRIRTKLSVNVQAAAMMRVLSLPAAFFKSYSSGELSQYLAYVNSLCTTLVDSIFSTAITGIFSLVYLTQIFSYAKSLVIPSLVVSVLTLGLSIAGNMAQSQINKELMELSAQERGLTYALMGGVEKIRLSGAENRVFTKWLDLYTRGADLKFNPPVIVKFQKVFNAAITLTGTIVMYFIAVKTRVSVADYYAFNTAYAYVSGALNAITSVAIAAATVKPSLELIRPLMEAVPEKHVGRESHRRPEPEDSRAPVCGDRRQDRLRQVDAAASAAGLRTARIGRDLLRPQGYPDAGSRVTSQTDRDRAAGGRALQRQHFREYYNLGAQSDSTGGLGRGGDRRDCGRHPRNAHGNEHCAAGRRRRNLRRPEAAHHDRAGSRPKA